MEVKFALSLVPCEPRLATESFGSLTSCAPITPRIVQNPNVYMEKHRKQNGCSVTCRYQPENSVAAYEMANTQDMEHEVLDLSNTEMLPDDQFSIKNLLCPSNTEPSHLSGSVVNICTSVLGKSGPRKSWLGLLKPC